MKKTNKKAEVGWSFIVKLIIGLLLLLVIVIMSAKAKGNFGDFFAKLGEMFG